MHDTEAWRNSDLGSGLGVPSAVKQGSPGAPAVAVAGSVHTGERDESPTGCRGRARTPDPWQTAPLVSILMLTYGSYHLPQNCRYIFFFSRGKAV